MTFGKASPGAVSSIVIVVTLMMLVTSSVSAQDQDQDQASFLLDVVKKVTLDPTTYAPAIVSWKATRLDWQSSQVFFQHGWFEHNPGFTVGGRGNDIPVSEAAGNRQIFRDSLEVLQVSLVNNVSERVIERLLMPRYPNHRKLLRTIGWIERSAMASYWSYRLSAGHLRQWQKNERLAQQLGYD